ncbi:hypothetical protein [Sphaerimonospora mesophila]|uniref:hypothetical protein n=1 Tax=Sphaerimonospora mesophila TaxID=37483 RepID=UPI0006E21B7E
MIWKSLTPEQQAHARRLGDILGVRTLDAAAHLEDAQAWERGDLGNEDLAARTGWELRGLDRALFNGPSDPMQKLAATADDIAGLRQELTDQTESLMGWICTAYRQGHSHEAIAAAAAKGLSDHDVAAAVGALGLYGAAMAALEAIGADDHEHFVLHLRGGAVYLDMGRADWPDGCDKLAADIETALHRAGLTLVLTGPAGPRTSARELLSAGTTLRVVAAWETAGRS